MIDVGDVLLDVDIAQTFTVLRRASTRTDKGREQVAVRRINNVVGVVCAASPNDLERLPEEQRMGRNLSIVTKFSLRGPAPGFQPDEVVWRGDTFLVKTVDPYPGFGPFVQAIAGSIDSQDRPMPGVGQMDFREPSNAFLAGAL